MIDNLRGAVAEVAMHFLSDRELAWLTQDQSLALADAVIRELTEAIPPIVATAIQGFAQSELAAMSYHGGSKDAFEVMEKMNREALQIAKYATTHEDWNG